MSKAANKKTTAPVENADADASEATVEAVKVPKEIVPVALESVGSGTLALRTYDGNDIAAFGQSFARSLIAQAAIEDEAQRLQATGNEAKQFLAFEMTRAAFDLSIKFEDDKMPVDIYAIFSTDTADVKKLNRNVLFHLGILKKEMVEQDDETVKAVYTYADPELEKLYEYNEKLKKDDEVEYTKRFNNRKRLNQRMSDAFKAAVVLRDQGLSSEDLFYSEDEKGEMVPTVRNAPKAIGGDKGVFQMNARTPVEGAKLSPTMTSLVKMANDKHKAVSAKQSDSAVDKQDGDAKMGMDDEAFGRIVNTLRTAITTQEGELTEAMVKHLHALNQFLVETLNNAE